MPEEEAGNQKRGRVSSPPTTPSKQGGHKKAQKRDSKLKKQVDKLTVALASAKKAKERCWKKIMQPCTEERRQGKSKN